MFRKNRDTDVQPKDNVQSALARRHAAQFEKLLAPAEIDLANGNTRSVREFIKEFKRSKLNYR